MFTGDAVTTAFTLSRIPASVTSIVVFIDGVKQASIGGSGAYTLLGTTLNFTAAPPNNAVVEVIHLGVQSLVNVPADATVTANSLAPELRTILADQFTANGTGTTFDLTTAPISSNSVIVTANGVVQYDYSISGSTLILNFTPTSGTLIRAAGMGNILTTGTITDDSVSSAKLQVLSVTTSKLADGSVTGPKIGLTAINANNIVDGSVTVAKGGTGLSTLTANSVVLGNGTDPVQLIAPGTSGNVLTSNGANWLSQAISAGGDYVMQAYTSPATWTKPAGLKAVKVTVIGGGGGGGSALGPGNPNGGGGGGGGLSYGYVDAPALPGPVTVTVGSGGGSAAAGGTSSFGPFISCTGGAAGGNGGSGSGAGAGGAGGTASGPGSLVGISGGSGSPAVSSTVVNLLSGGGGAAGGASATVAKATALASSEYDTSFSTGGSGGWGSGANGLQGTTNPGTNGTGYGSAGSGAQTSGLTPRAGGSGTGGLIIVEEFY